MPYNADGSTSRGSVLATQQAHRLQEAWRRRVPVLLWDESWSSRMAEGVPKRLGRRKSSNALAARVILQEVVDALVPWELQLAAKQPGRGGAAAHDQPTEPLGGG